MIREKKNSPDPIVKYRNAVAYGLLNTLSNKKNNTYCPYLWEMIFINPRGDVSCCCNQAPEPIGNIYKRDIYDIWNKGKKARLFRWMTLNGCLPCFASCDIISPQEKDGNVRHYETNPKHPRVVQIMHSFRCNLKCIMCAQPHRSKIVLDNAPLRENIDWSKIDDIILQGGEVFAVKNALDLYIWLTERLKKKVNVITNGLLIKGEWAQRLLKGSRWIEISVNAATAKTHEAINIGSNFQRVIGNIKGLIDLKRRSGLDTEISYHFTVVPQNAHEIVEAIKFADTLGCDRITYNYDIQTAPRFLQKNPRLVENLREQLRRLISNGKLKIIVRRNHLETLGIARGINGKNFIDNF